MAYKMWIPVFNRRWNEKQKEELITLLKAAECDLALITYERVLCDRALQDKTEEIFKENRDFLLSHGIDVGTWLFHTIGYGAAFGGLAALLSMLNSCASGVSVVNIDNGFGAGYLASMMNHMGGAK